MSQTFGPVSPGSGARVKVCVVNRHHVGIERPSFSLGVWKVTGSRCAGSWVWFPDVRSGW